MSLQVGLIARGEDRGLGVLTRAFYDHLRPDRTLLVDLGQLARGFPCHHRRYPDATVVRFDGAELPERVVRDWLAGLDVVYSAETFYDWRICTWAAEHGVATVLHVMPEFYRHGATPELPAPTVWWAPTTWRLDTLPDGTRLVPVPIEGPPTTWADADSRPLRVVHVAGHRAANDRNGTDTFLQAARYMREPAQVTVHSQDRRLANRGPVRRGVSLQLRLGGVTHRADLYARQQLLVLPRRYGGLCLPAQEAMAAGLAVAMPDVPPNTTDWPVVPIPARLHTEMATQAGPVALAEVAASSVAHVVDRLAANPGELAEWQAASRAWARFHSWAALGQLYRDELQAAAEKRL